MSQIIDTNILVNLTGGPIVMQPPGNITLEIQKACVTLESQAITAAWVGFFLVLGVILYYRLGRDRVAESWRRQIDLGLLACIGMVFGFILSRTQNTGLIQVINTVGVVVLVAACAWWGFQLIKKVRDEQ